MEAIVREERPRSAVSSVAGGDSARGSIDDALSEFGSELGSRGGLAGSIAGSIGSVYAGSFAGSLAGSERGSVAGDDNLSVVTHETELVDEAAHDEAERCSTVTSLSVHPPSRCAAERGGERAREISLARARNLPLAVSAPPSIPPTPPFSHRTRSYGGEMSDAPDERSDAEDAPPPRSPVTRGRAHPRRR